MISLSMVLLAAQNNYALGIIGLILLGIFLILAAKYQWDWLFDGPSGKMFTIQWFHNHLGPKAGRIMTALVGVAFILIAGLVFVINYIL